MFQLENRFKDRLERILTMVYVVQSYWAYFGLYPSSSMWKTKDHVVVVASQKVYIEAFEEYHK
jgi:hypothetical protein